MVWRRFHGFREVIVSVQPAPGRRVAKLPGGGGFGFRVLDIVGDVSPGCQHSSRDKWFSFENLAAKITTQMTQFRSNLEHVCTTFYADLSRKLAAPG